METLQNEHQPDEPEYSPTDRDINGLLPEHDAAKPGKQAPHDQHVWSRARKVIRSNVKGFLEGVAAVAVIAATFVYAAQYLQSLRSAASDISIKRPFVLPVSISTQRLSDESVIIRQIWRNVGVTAAEDCKALWTWEELLPASVDNIHWKSSAGDQSPVPANSEMHDEIVLTPLDRTAISQRGRFFILGRITYGDYFPDRHESDWHLVEYCAEASRIINTPVEFSWGLTSNCKRFSCIDEGCGDDYTREKEAHMWNEQRSNRSR